MSTTERILVVDDDTDILELESQYLAKQGFEVYTASTIVEFKSKLQSLSPDLVLLDVMLPDGSGLDACKELRAAGVRTPIIMVTAITDDIDRILGLELGADDYVPKPFNPRELVARIRAVLRRISGQTPAEDDRIAKYLFEGFVCDPASRTVKTSAGEEVAFTGAEFDLLKVFLDRPQRLISRVNLLDLTNKTADTFDTTINVLMSRIRKKLNDHGAPEDLLRTVRGSGYQLTCKVQKV